jgi:hypothetical protein
MGLGGTADGGWSRAWIATVQARGRAGARMNVWDPEDDQEQPALPWWAAIGGCVVFAAGALALIWGFALIEWLMEALA